MGLLRALKPESSKKHEEDLSSGTDMLDQAYQREENAQRWADKELKELKSEERREKTKTGLNKLGSTIGKLAKKTAENMIKAQKERAKAEREKPHKEGPKRNIDDGKIKFPF